MRIYGHNTARIKKTHVWFRKGRSQYRGEVGIRDLNKGKFKSTGDNIADEVFSIVPAISWRPTAQTVIRFNYRYNWQKDILGNPPAKLAGFNLGCLRIFKTGQFYMF